MLKRCFSTGKQLLGKDAILRALVNNNVDTIFGYSGGAILPAFELEIFQNLSGDLSSENR